MKILLNDKGTRLFTTKNVPIAIIMEAAISGTITLANEMPADFIAISSLFSAIWPIVITEANRVARGSARGSIVAPPQPINSSITFSPSPFPTNSSIYTHKNCIIKMKTTTKRIAKNGPINDFNMNWSSFFTL